MKQVFLAGALLMAAAPVAGADKPGVDSGFRPPIPARPVAPQVPILPRDLIVYDREVVVEKQVEVEKKGVPPAPAAAPEPPAEKRKPYAIGNVYSSLPGSCMKMIEAGASYYHCNGEWYQRVGGEYKAVKAP